MLVKANKYHLTERTTDLTLTQIQAYSCMNSIWAEMEKEARDKDD